MEWIIPCNEDKFKLKECLDKYGCVDWHKKVQYDIGYYIYIYCSKPSSRIKYVMQVTDILNFENTIDDKEFGYDSTWQNCKEFIRLKPIKTINVMIYLINNIQRRFIMKVDKIIKNAKVFTSDVKQLITSAFAVKNGKFIYVGDEAGLVDFEGEVVDFGGKFVTPAMMDSHVHIPLSIGMCYVVPAVNIVCSNKAECVEFIGKYIKENPDLPDYSFTLRLVDLHDEKLVKEDLDAVCPDKAIIVREEEFHSGWLNSKCLEKIGVNDDTPDISAGLSYYERDENGHITGHVFEMIMINALLSNSGSITDNQIRESIYPWIDFCKEYGISAVFEAGTPCAPELHERVYDVLKKMDEDGELPIIVDCCYSICTRDERNTVMNTLKRYREKYNTKHLRFNTLKIMLDGTLRIHTGSLITPYPGTNDLGGVLFNKDELAEIIKMINVDGYNLHLHTVGEGAVRTVLDAVEIVRNELGDDLKTKVTSAHLEIVNNSDISRFAKLGVNANYTAWWHYGDCAGGTKEGAVALVGEERADQLYRCKSVYKTGANVCFSSDTTAFYFDLWSPYFGIEIAANRRSTEKSKVYEVACRHSDVPFASEEERMTIEESILCYTINNAKQLCIEDTKGSIEVGKDADYLVFEEDFLNCNPEGLSQILPKEVFFEGVKIK